MKNRILISGLLLLTLLVATSCHQESDVVLSYANNDDLSFGEASKSFAGKYRVFWKAMNINYALWDYEKENGLDWDEHYKTFLPKFEALDEADKVTDDELKKLMTEMAAPLHDGHLAIRFQNHHTGNYIAASPSAIRHTKENEHYEEESEFEPNLAFYKNDLADYLESNTAMVAQLKYVISTENIGLKWAEARYAELAAKEKLSEKEAFDLQGLKEFCDQIYKIKSKQVTVSLIQQYNAIAIKYAYLNIPYLDTIDTSFDDVGINIKYALFKDGIAYLYFDGFSLSAYLEAATYKAFFSQADSHTEALVDRVKKIWLAWINSIQQLHKSQKLKGVIIDVRNNVGGFMSDAQYTLGSLLPQGGLQVGYDRYKRGLGRYDYSALTPQIYGTLDAEHEIINDVPIVVLANVHSVSMAEITSSAVKLIPNGKLIGTRTHGGLCGLTGIEEFSLNYTGYIGIKDKTPVYCYIPTLAYFNMDKKCLEGIGVEPDIEVSLDREQFSKTGRDTQLDRALEYIRTTN